MLLNMKPINFIAGIIVAGAFIGGTIVFSGTAPTTSLPQSDYKFWYIKRDDSGVITEAAVRYFEGTTTTTVVPATSPIVTGTTTIPAHSTTTAYTYIRTKRLQQVDLTQFSTQTFVKEQNGNDVVIYTPKDFGSIKTDVDLRTFLNTQLAKDTTRTPIAAEAVTAQPI